MTLTAQRLREVMSYDPGSGVLRWKVDQSPQVCAGDLAGTKNSAGRVIVGVDHRIYLAHRLAVLYMTGSWPDAAVAHSDYDYGNNRWSNLIIGRRARRREAAMAPLVSPKEQAALTLWACWSQPVREAEACEA